MSNAQFNDIGACVFDAYGTLFDFNSAVERCRDKLGDKADPLSATWRQKQLQYTWLRSLMGKFEDFWTVTGDSLDFALAAVGIDDPPLRTELMQLYLELDDRESARSYFEASIKRLIKSGRRPGPQGTSPQVASRSRQSLTRNNAPRRDTTRSIPRPQAYRLQPLAAGVEPNG